MSREIKFRAWHKNSNHMCQNVKTDLLDRDYLEFMQYTGLDDKNGKEIYEGDIIKIYSIKYDEIFLIGKVCFVDGMFKVTGKGYYLIDGDGTSLCSFRVREVIGNIYENPELLEGDKA